MSGRLTRDRQSMATSMQSSLRGYIYGSGISSPMVRALLAAPRRHRPWLHPLADLRPRERDLALTEKVGLLAGAGQFGSLHDTYTALWAPRDLLQRRACKHAAHQERLGLTCGISAAATFSRRLMQARDAAMAQEFRGKGTLCVIPKLGVAGKASGPTHTPARLHLRRSQCIHCVGVRACAKHLVAKHLVANNQEHWRYGLSAIIDDRTIHEMHLYPFLRAIETAGGRDFNHVRVPPAERHVVVPYPGSTGAKWTRARCGFPGPGYCLFLPRKFLRRGINASCRLNHLSDWGATRTHDSVSDNEDAGLDMEQPKTTLSSAAACLERRFFPAPVRTSRCFDTHRKTS
ncbi:hypothetical protein GGX14DRAFT_625527 [Mycena pura]|uniref:beta-glucosidase n=1 Tax=Mycena pura TaxID=153505 RepID=A0AAD6YDE4_9AGAR|nr:hypothetical protein GGX14DRAFT_625527 [Mycena pura]